MRRPPFNIFPSRRSVVHSTNGIVACTQPLAAQSGLRILQAGGNAADAAVAVAACLGVTEPTSTGIGGDVFCLFYDASTNKIRGLNASGRAPAALTLERARSSLGENVGRIPMDNVHSVTVPGAAAGWVDVIDRFGSGKVGRAEVFRDAIRHAEEGFPVSELSASFWQECETVLRKGSPNWREMLRHGERAPRAGEIMKMPLLGGVMREVVNKGTKGFYEGWVAERIVEAVNHRGGLLALSDLKEHAEKGSEEVRPISLEFEKHMVWECAPNGQGLVALMALGIIESLEERGVIPKLGRSEQPGWRHNQVEYLHTVIEALRIAFSDGHYFIADPATYPVPVPGLLDKSYLEKRSELFSPETTNETLPHGSPAFSSSDTVYFSVTDAFGNGCSFINSTFGGFGCGIVPRGCGFNLQNRGSGFSLNPDHPNALAPRKRPYHTIIPGLLTDPSGAELKAVFGVMGGFMQPQGHVQVLLNLLRNGMDEQRALDAPRILIGEGYDPEAKIVYLEAGIEESIKEGLRKKGHVVQTITGWNRGHFGRGQIITAKIDDGKRVYSAGSDMRGDGHAVGY